MAFESCWAIDDTKPNAGDGGVRVEGFGSGESGTGRSWRGWGVVMKIILRWEDSESAQINADPSQVCCFYIILENIIDRLGGAVLFHRATRKIEVDACLRSGDES